MHIELALTTTETTLSHRLPEDRVWNQLLTIQIISMLSPPEPTRHCCPLELTTPPPPPSPLCLSPAPLCVCAGGSGRLWVRPQPSQCDGGRSRGRHSAGGLTPPVHYSCLTSAAMRKGSHSSAPNHSSTAATKQTLNVLSWRGREFPRL